MDGTYKCMEWTDHDRQCGYVLSSVLVVQCGLISVRYYTCEFHETPIVACVGPDDLCYRVPVSEFMVTEVMDA